MTDEQVPILDFDPNRSAIIEPGALHPQIDGLPHRCVITCMAAIAEFRGVRLGHGLYVADTLHSNQWDPKELVERNTSFRYQLLLTAARACASL